MLDHYLIINKLLSYPYFSKNEDISKMFSKDNFEILIIVLIDILLKWKILFLLAVLSVLLKLF